VTSYLALPNLGNSYGVQGISTVPMKMSGWVTSEIVKLLESQLLFQMELVGRGRIATDELMFLEREFIKGDLTIESIPRLYDSTPLGGAINVELLLQSRAFSDKSMPLARDLIIKDILPDTLARTRSGD
jgi:hypothetical protein